MRLNSRSSGRVLTAIVLAWATCNVAFAEEPKTPVAKKLPPKRVHSNKMWADFGFEYSPKSGWTARVVNIHDGSPLLQEGIRLEVGDTILTLDDLKFKKPSSTEFDKHYAETKVVFINVKTNEQETRYVHLP